jgi:hypothetical protein
LGLFCHHGAVSWLFVLALVGLWAMVARDGVGVSVTGFGSGSVCCCCFLHCWSLSLVVGIAIDLLFVPTAGVVAAACLACCGVAVVDCVCCVVVCAGNCAVVVAAFVVGGCQRGATGCLGCFVSVTVSCARGVVGAVVQYCCLPRLACKLSLGCQCLGPCVVVLAACAAAAVCIAWVCFGGVRCAAVLWLFALPPVGLWALVSSSHLRILVWAACVAAGARLFANCCGVADVAMWTSGKVVNVLTACAGVVGCFACRGAGPQACGHCHCDRLILGCVRWFCCLPPQSHGQVMGFAVVVVLALAACAAGVWLLFARLSRGCGHDDVMRLPS